MKDGGGKVKPSVVWLEGVLDYFNAPFPHDSEDPRALGFGIGRQIIGLYLVEMLLKYALDVLGEPYRSTHYLLDLYNKLPEETRKETEAKYKAILEGAEEETFDYSSTIAMYLEYLGEDPFKESRYFWETGRSYGGSIIFAAGRLRHLVYAIFVVLHNYPERGSEKKRYETKIISLTESFASREARPERDMPRKGKRITTDQFWMEGLLEYFSATFPHEEDDPRTLGFQVGQRMIGLYLVEVLLKYALDDMNVQYRNTHNFARLFAGLPRPRRRAVSALYRKILNNRVEWTWDFAEDVDTLLQHLADNALRDARYFWEVNEPRILSPGPLEPLIYALLIELHSYPQRGPLVKKYETSFVSLEESLGERLTEA